MQNTGNQFKNKIIRENPAAVGPELMCGIGINFFILRRKVHPERNTEHVELQRVGYVPVLHILAVIRKIDHGLQVQILSGIGKDFLQHIIRIRHCAVIFGLGAGPPHILPVKFLGHPFPVAVMAALHVHNNEIILFSGNKAEIL